jgi:eukaryotic-like serine/threonine-protein kinase
MTVCLTDEQLLALAENTAAPAARSAAIAHAATCAPCRELIAGTVTAGAAPDPLGATMAGGESAETATQELFRGSTVGRYVILDLVGAGAMGAVHSAYDPELDRKIAIKIIQPRSDEAPSAKVRARLLQEAQVMARLAHPNVLSVFDAGTVGDRLFLAMELVEGEDLRAWLARRRRAWREVLSVFLLAGRGLAAAHAAGIVHRDFKPENVLVGSDGRVRVGDFGLAHLPRDRDLEPPAVATPRAATGTLTRTGDLLGTPAYMAPEQLRGEPATPASDQFSFCVSLYEALFGNRPFGGESPGALLADIERGSPRSPAAGSGAPAWIRKVILTGLRARPEDRFAGMDALLSALARDPARAARRAAAVLAMAGVVAGAATVAYRAHRREALLCTGAEAELAGIWDVPHKSAVRAALLAGGRSYAATVADSVGRQLDAYTRSWVAMHTESCEATRKHGTQSDELLDLRIQCLRREREDLRALVALIARPAPGLADQALKAVYALPPVARCQADATLRARIPPPSDAGAAARVAELRTALSETRALLAAGRFEAALQAAAVLSTAARALEYRPVEAEALETLADAYMQRRKLDDAVATYALAFRAASAGGDERTAAEALAGMAWVQGVLQGRRVEGYAVARDAEVLAQRLGDGKVTASLLYDEAVYAYEDGDLAAARARFERALAIREKLLGADSPDAVSAIDALGNLSVQTGALADARAHHERALAVAERTVGPDHPSAVPAIGNLARVLLIEGDYERARTLAARAHDLASAARGRDSVTAGLNQLTLAQAVAELGDYRGGVALLEETLQILMRALGPANEDVSYVRERLVGPLVALGRYPDALAQAELSLQNRRKEHPGDHRYVAASLEVQALALSALGRGDEAVSSAAQAERMAARIFAPDHWLLARARVTLCRVLVDTGRDEAPASCARALAASSLAFPSGHPLVAEAQALVGEAELLAGRAEAAVPPLEAALAYLEPRHGDVLVRALARFALARALVDAGGDRARADTLTRAARADLAAIGDRAIFLRADPDRAVSSRQGGAK